MSPPTLSDEVAAIASMGWKITVTTFSRVALAAIPTIFLGRLGTAELAAGALAGVWTSLVQMPTFGVSAALCTLCAQAFGAKNSELVVVWLQLALLVLLTLSVPIMASLCFVDRLLGFVTNDDQALSLAAAYARWLIPSVVPQAVHAALRKFLQAQQIVTPATVVGVASIPVSFILHYVLVFGCGPVPALGLVGSPVAQSITALFQAAALAVYTLRNTCKTFRHDWNLEACFQPDRVREFASLAAGVTVQYALDEGVFSATAVIAGRIGPAALAAHSVLASLWQFLFGVFWGLGMPTQVRVAGFLGANEPSYARRSLRVGLALGFIAAVVTVLIVFTARRQVTAVYTSDPTLASLIEHTLPILAIAALFSGPHVVLVGAVEALALASALVGATLVGSWLVMLPTAYALALSSHYGLNGVWWAAVGGEAAKFALMAATLLRVDWRAESSRAAQRARNVRSESDEKEALTPITIQVTNGDMEDGTGRDPEHGVPRRAIFLSFSIIVFMGLFDFDTILGVDNFLSALSSLTEMAAAVRMRFSHPEIERPYRVNLSDRALALAMVLPFVLGSFIMVNELTKSWASFVLNTVALVLGLVAQKWIERHPYHQYSVDVGLLDTPRLKDLTMEY